MLQVMLMRLNSKKPNKHRMEKDKVFLKLIKTYYGVVASEALLNTKLEAQNAL